MSYQYTLCWKRPPSKDNCDLLKHLPLRDEEFPENVRLFGYNINVLSCSDSAYSIHAVWLVSMDANDRDALCDSDLFVIEKIDTFKCDIVQSID
jgi:hypothetical protein